MTNSAICCFWKINLLNCICQKIQLDACEKICLHAFVRKSSQVSSQMSLTVVTHTTYICPYLYIFSQIEFCICKSLCVCLKVEFLLAKQILFIYNTLDLFDEYWHKIRSILKHLFTFSGNTADQHELGTGEFLSYYIINHLDVFTKRPY